MKIALSNIKPSPKPIRTTWDKTKLEELKWSLMEEGQVEPVGVHENGTGYVIVWGHRRVEAARRAGWKEVEAVVVPSDEIDNLIQAGIENLAGEDMSAEDKADWAFRLTELGLSQREISRRSSVPSRTIVTWLTYRREKENGVALISAKSRLGDEAGMDKVAAIASALGDDTKAKKAIAAKVSEDDLTTLQTREIARAYRDAPTPAIKRQILSTPIVSRDTAADILRRSTNRYEMETGVKAQAERSAWGKERDEKRMIEAWKFPVKDFLAAGKLFDQAVRKNMAAIKNGAYSPEAAKFTARQIGQLIDLLKTTKELLEDVK